MAGPGLYSLGTTATLALHPNPRRKVAVITNQDTGDEAVRAHNAKEDLANQAIIAYNRESIKFTGKAAQDAIWMISDTAATAVTVSELF